MSMYASSSRLFFSLSASWSLFSVSGFLCSSCAQCGNRRAPCSEVMYTRYIAHVYMMIDRQLDARRGDIPGDDDAVRTVESSCQAAM